MYKKVAVVEDFFDIIYREHVEFMNSGPGGPGGHGSPGAGRAPAGKHAGQKRTYRAVSDRLALLCSRPSAPAASSAAAAAASTWRRHGSFERDRA